MSGLQPVSGKNKVRWRPTPSFWITGGLLLLLALLFGAAGGIGGVVLVLGIAAALTGLFVLAFKRRSWLGLPSRKAGSLVAGLGVVAFVVGTTVAVATAGPLPQPALSDSTNTASSSASASPTDTPTATEQSPALTACDAVDVRKTYADAIFVCTRDKTNHLVWLDQDESKKVVAQAAADKAAAVKLAAQKTAAAKIAANKAAVVRAEAARAAAQQAAVLKVAAAQEAAAQQSAAAAAQQAAAPAAPAPDPNAPAAPAPNPNAASGATALCNDGSLSFSANHRGTCSHHQGVRTWYK